MMSSKHKARSPEHHGFSDADLAAVADNPEWTEADFARARPFAEVFPDLAEKIRTGGVKVVGSSEVVSLRLDAILVAHLRATGPGWEDRVNETLKKAVGLE